jgi:hypothetical protein
MRGPGNTSPNLFTKTAMLCNYKFSDILQIQFAGNDNYHRGTIQQWAMTTAGQLKDYIKSPQVTQRVLNEQLEMRAHLVIIVGSHQILLWDMNKDGNLADEPRLVGMTINREW